MYYWGHGVVGLVEKGGERGRERDIERERKRQLVTSPHVQHKQLLREQVASPFVQHTQLLRERGEPRARVDDLPP